MNYSVVDVPGNSDYNLKGIRLSSGKTCVYWTKKNARQLSEVVVYMDNRNVAAIKDNQICISLHGIKDIQSQRDCLRAFCEQLRGIGINVRQIRFRFIVADKNEAVMVQDMIKDLGLNAEIMGSAMRRARAGVGVAPGNSANNNPEQVNKATKQENIKNKIADEREILADSDISKVVKYDDGVRKEINVDEARGVAYDTSYENLSMQELVMMKYKELMKDPVWGPKLLEMPEKDAVKLVVNEVNKDRKTYYMEQNAGYDMSSMSENERATANVASKNEGISNNELGVVNNGVNKDNKFSVVESNNGSMREVSPNVSNIGMNGTTSSSGNRDSEEVVVEGKETEREEIQNNIVSYYVDDDTGKVYDGNKMEFVEGAYCNENNQIVDSDGNILGDNCGNLNDMYANASSESKENERQKTMILYKKNNSIDTNSEKSAAFISLPVIIFIISLILFMASGIIWFITK
ncbi:MAG: hypothetical protein VZS44_00225 [Bacilli bacterium]|nr:hypothetical protein [Bacilli bacterium]